VTGIAKGKAAFDDSPLMQVWMVHHLLIIGEAVRAIDPALKPYLPPSPFALMGWLGTGKHDGWTGESHPGGG